MALEMVRKVKEKWLLDINMVVYMNSLQNVQNMEKNGRAKDERRNKHKNRYIYDGMDRKILTFRREQCKQKKLRDFWLTLKLVGVNSHFPKKHGSTSHMVRPQNLFTIRIRIEVYIYYAVRRLRADHVYNLHLKMPFSYLGLCFVQNEYYKSRKETYRPVKWFTH